MANEIKNILIVDDEKNIRRLISGILTQNGYSCYEADSVDSTFTILRERDIDVVLLDINMPEKSGLEMLPIIVSVYPGVATIMVTANTDSASAVDCMKQGAVDYLTKPFSSEELLNSVENALRKMTHEIAKAQQLISLQRAVEEQSQRLENVFMESINSLVLALEAKDKYTHGHSKKVADISVEICHNLGLDNEMVSDVRLAGLLHDIGKIGIDESILNKKGRLTEDEMLLVQQHPVIGERIISPLRIEKSIGLIVRNHHERYDGKGYPDGLTRENIPLGARILAVADAYDAMTSDRSYRRAMTPQAALKQVVLGQGKQFDPSVVYEFLRARHATENSPMSV